MKKQKRILLNTKEKLFEKFRLENTKTELSYTTFCRLRPFFWVVMPKENDGRLVHVNCMKIYSCWQKLCTEKKLSKRKIFTHWLICSLVIPKINSCMYGKCPGCREINISTSSELDKNEEVKWAQWQTRIDKKIEKRSM